MRQQNELLIRALLVAVVVLALASPSGLAAPAGVHVRVEGVRSTLFDRVVLTGGHDVRAVSDTQARRCDGTNAGSHPDPGPTATAATVDALATLGQTFDGRWNAGFDDYFIQQLGAEREDDDALWWWGLLVDRAFAPAGGCQMQVSEGAEVLWVGDAFSGRPFLSLAAAAAETPAVQVGAPLTVVVGATGGGPAGDGASAAPYAGAAVEAVDANGQPAAVGIAVGDVSAADGSAVVRFAQAGWQRLKAHAPVLGGPGSAPPAIASASLDVCVEAAPGAGCAGPPPSRVPVVPPGVDEPGPGGAPPPGGGGAAPPPPAPPDTGPAPPPGPAVSRPAWMRRLVAGERVRVRLDAGRPAFALRLGARRARVELRADGRSRRVTLLRGRGGVRVVEAPRLRRAGWVELRVLRGVVRVEDVRRAR